MVRLRQIVHDRTVLGFCEGVVVGVAGERRAELSYVGTTASPPAPAILLPGWLAGGGSGQLCHPPIDTLRILRDLARMRWSERAGLKGAAENIEKNHLEAGTRMRNRRRV